MANSDFLSSNDQNRHAMLVASALDAIITIDDQGTVLEFNPSAETMFGWSAKEAVGNKISDLIIPPRYREAHKQGVRHYMSKGEGPVLGKKIDIEALHRSGHEFPVELTITPIRVGKKTLFTAFLRDRIQSSELSRKLQIANFTIQHSRDSIFWINETGKIMDCNLAVASGLGYTHEQLLTMSVFDIDPAMTREAWPIHWCDLRDSGSVQMESTHRRADGSEFPVDVSANYIMHDGEEYNCAFVRDISRRKAAEREVSESSKRLSLVLDAAELGFWDIDFRTRDKIVNAQYLRIFDVPYEEFSPDLSWFMDRVHPDDLERLEKSIQDALTYRTERCDIEYRIRRSDGQWRWIHDRGRIIEHDHDGTAVRMMGAMQDITHLHQAADDLLKSEQRYNDIVDSLGGFFWEADAEFRIRFNTKSITKLTGVSPEETIGVAFSDLTTSEHSLRVHSAFEKCQRSGEPIRDLELPMVTRSGEIRWARLNARAVTSSTGDYEGFRGTGLDITADRAAALAKSRSIKLQVITRAIVIELLKPGEISGQIDTLLAKLGEFLGADRAYLLRAEKSMERVLCSAYWYSDRLEGSETSYPLGCEKIDPSWFAKLELNQPVNVHGSSASNLPYWVHHLTRSHLGIPVLIEGVPKNYLVFEGLDEEPFWSEGDIPILVSLASSLGYAIERRITKRKLEESAHQLEYEARRAEAASDAKSVFLAQMSHELRTPLTAVIGSAQILSKKSDPKRESQLLSSIDSNGRMLLSIINSILDLSKLERGETPINLAQTSIIEIIEQVRASVMPIALLDAVEIQFEIKSKIPSEIITDEFQLAQVLTNLINNAIKYAKSPLVEVHISIFKGSSGVLEFEVIDYGVGIDQDDLHRIFEPFERATDGTSSGTGLGLSICKRIVESLDGTIECESIPEERTRFSFTIPLKDHSLGELAPGVIMQNHHDSPISTEDNSRVLMGVRVLLVEDSVHIREVVEYFLVDMGAIVEVCVNGLEAVYQVQAHGDEIDVILMDMQMPMMDGYEATQKLRKDGCTLPIIALTAHGLAEDRKKSIDVGCDDYLGKPVNPDLLASTINHILHRTTNGFNLMASTETTGSAEPHSETLPDDLIVRYREYLYKTIGDLNPIQCEPESIRKLVHQIKGTAGTMGLAAIAIAAQKADQLIRQNASDESISKSLAKLVASILDDRAED